MTPQGLVPNHSFCWAPELAGSAHSISMICALGSSRHPWLVNNGVQWLSMVNNNVIMIFNDDVS